MKKEFLCLAKSKKYGGRCVAGIVIKRVDGRIGIEKDDSGHPIWIRPVSSEFHGSVDINVGKSLDILGIYEIDNVVSNPQGFQVENANFDHPNFALKTTIRPSLKSLNMCVRQSQTSSTFGNNGKAIIASEIDNLNYSIKLIKVDSCEVFMKEREGKSDQHRLKFNYNGSNYDLVITDLEFIEQYDQNNEYLNDFNDFYLVLSVAIENNGWYSKLVATIITL